MKEIGVLPPWKFRSLAVFTSMEVIYTYMEVYGSSTENAKQCNFHGGSKTSTEVLSVATLVLIL